jgi:hypothetical protein
MFQINNILSERGGIIGTETYTEPCTSPPVYCILLWRIGNFSGLECLVEKVCERKRVAEQ